MKCSELLELKKEREASTSAATAGAWYHFRSATYKNKTKNFSISYNSTDLSKLLFYFCICQHHQSIQTNHTVHCPADLTMQLLLVDQCLLLTLTNCSRFTVCHCSRRIYALIKERLSTTACAFEHIRVMRQALLRIQHVISLVVNL